MKICIRKHFLNICTIESVIKSKKPKFMRLVSNACVIVLMNCLWSRAYARSSPTSACSKTAHVEVDCCKEICDQQVSEYEKLNKSGIPPKEEKTYYAGCNEVPTIFVLKEIYSLKKVARVMSMQLIRKGVWLVTKDVFLG